MRCRIAILTVSLITIWSSSVIGQTPNAPATPLAVEAKSQVAAAEKSWLNAFYRLDAATLETTESSDFTFVAPPAMVTRDQQLKLVRQRFATAATPRTPTAYEIGDQTIRVYGDVGLVSDTCTILGGSDSRIMSPGRYWQTEVWRKEGSSWKLVHVHISPVEHGM